MKINYLGSVYSSRAAVAQMKETGGGRLVFVSSLGGLIGVTGFTTYSPSKFAVRGLAEVLHMELQPHNIQVSVLFLFLFCFVLFLFCFVFVLFCFVFLFILHYSYDIFFYSKKVSLVNPADVNTPMYEEEMKSKPLACKMISEGF